LVLAAIRQDYRTNLQSERLRNGHDGVEADCQCVVEGRYIVTQGQGAGRSLMDLSRVAVVGAEVGSRFRMNFGVLESMAVEECFRTEMVVGVMEQRKECESRMAGSEVDSAGRGAEVCHVGKYHAVVYCAAEEVDYIAYGLRRLVDRTWEAQLQNSHLVGCCSEYSQSSGLAVAAKNHGQTCLLHCP